MIDPLFPILPSVVVALLVLGGLIYLETRRRMKYPVMRIISQILLVTSVLLLTLRPSLTVTDHQALLLLTEGYEQKTVDSLTSNNSSLKPVTVSSFNDLSKLGHVSIITGNGLPSWALDLMPSRNYSFVPATQPKGITGLETGEHIYAHRWNEIRGTYNSEGAVIKLRGPGGIDDSVKVSRGMFSVSFFAKAPGRFNYDLITPEGTEIIPLIIEPERTFNILFVSDYPTFEVRYLKNFLAAKGHRLSVRNQVSRGKYKFEFANRPVANFRTLTGPLLSDTDLLVIDERSWSALGSGEQKTLRAAISDGLGVILLPESKPAKSNSHLIDFYTTHQKDTVRVSLGRAGTLRLPALPLETKKPNALLSSTDKRTVYGYHHLGAGKIGYQLLMETYQAGLQGKSEIYSALWVPLLEKTARTIKEDFKFRITSPFPLYGNEPIAFDIVSSGKQPHLSIDNIPLPLKEDVYIDDLWHGTAWLEGNSWHDFVIDSITTSVHVTKEDTWKTLRASNNRKATALHGDNDEAMGAISSQDESTFKMILFSVFVLAAGFLWLAPKL